MSRFRNGGKRLGVGMSTVVAANIEEGAALAAANLEEGVNKVQRPWLCFVLGTFGLVILVAGSGPLLTLLTLSLHKAPQRAAATPFLPEVVANVPRVSHEVNLLPQLSPPPPPPPPSPQQAIPTCGDGKCEASETAISCFLDCPGVTTPPTCGEEPHSDPQGNAVVDGRGHHVKSAGECCDACSAHAIKYPKRPCNSWVFCYMPHCWSADNGNTHLFGECWLKHQSDPTHPLYGQRGAYTEEFRRLNADKHLNGRYPEDQNSVQAMKPFGIVPGSRRNLTVPTHVPWTGGVLGVKVDLSVTWTTGADGSMRSSAGDVVVDYRPWESREQNLKRGVKPEQMKF